MNPMSPFRPVDPDTKRYWRARYVIAYPVQSFALTISFATVTALVLGHLYSLAVHRHLPLVPWLLGLSLGVAFYIQDRRWAVRVLTRIRSVPPQPVPVETVHIT
jgi:predicted outer membrane lipoprotein